MNAPFPTWGGPSHRGASSGLLCDASEGVVVTGTGDLKRKDKTKLLGDPSALEGGGRRGGGLGLTRWLKVRTKSATPKGRWLWLGVRNLEQGVNGNCSRSRPR